MAGCGLVVASHKILCLRRGFGDSGFQKVEDRASWEALTSRNSSFYLGEVEGCTALSESEKGVTNDF